MIKFLRSGSLKRPRSVHRPGKPGTAGHGLLVPSFDEGTVLVKNVGGEVIRVSWESPRPKTGGKPNQSSDRRPPRSEASRLRALPSGVYTLVGYRVIRRDKSGRSWLVSATASRGIRKFAVVAGKRSTLEIDEQVVVDCAARRTKLGLRLLVTVAGEIESGLTIYRAGRRISIEYRVLDATGRVLARGPMEYG